MNQEKKNLFLKYLNIFCIGFFIGICFGTIMILVPTQKYTFVIALLGTVSIVLLWKFADKYDFDLVFGFSMSLGMGLMAGIYFLMDTNLTDACKAFIMVCLAFFINYACLKLIRHTIRGIIDQYKEKNK